MNIMKALILPLALTLSISVTAEGVSSPVHHALLIGGQQGSQDTGRQGATTRRIGAIKAITGTVITLSPDSGPEVSVTVQETTRLVRIPPGEKDLKNASPIALQDLQVGDRILAGGRPCDDGKSIVASSIVVMKRSDVEARQEQLRQDWQKRGMGGLVSAVDPASGTVTISVSGLGGAKTVLVHTTKDTVVRRYAPESVRFEEAKPSTLQEVRPGDQLRARGTRSADGTEFTAEEIVTGSFRNIAGTVNSVDAAAGTLSVQDLLSKKTVQIKVTADSQLHQLPAEFAQRIAMRLKGTATTGGAGANANAAPGQLPVPSRVPGPPAGGAGPPGGPGPGGMGGGMHANGSADFQQLLKRMPAVTLQDLHKGNALMIVATQDGPSGVSTAITLLSGVEPILEAAPSASQAMMLTPWSLGGAPNGDAGNQ